MIQQRIHLPILCWATLLLAARDLRASVARNGSDAKEVARVRAEHPRAVELLEEGETLFGRGDYLQASDVFQRSAVEAPDMSLPPRRRCEVLIRLGRCDKALDSCHAA